MSASIALDKTTDVSAKKLVVHGSNMLSAMNTFCKGSFQMSLGEPVSKLDRFPSHVHKMML